MTTTTPTSAAIHDIGYRHYDGDRRGRSFIRRALYVDSLKGAFGLGRSAQAPVAVSLDLRFGVISLYFSRPARSSAGGWRGSHLTRHGGRRS